MIQEVEGVKALEQFFGVTVTVDRQPNVGRCDHSYAHWINENYSRIKEEYIASGQKNDANQDLILFIKDNDYNAYSYIPFPTLFANAVDSGFACVQKGGWKLYLDCSEGCTQRETDTGGPYQMYLPLELHERSVLEQFGIFEYAHLERDDKSNFLSQDNYKSLGEWKNNIGLVFPDTGYTNMCNGGNFLFQKRGGLMQSAAAWSKLEKSLARGDNIQEGHFAERAWASLLTPPSCELPLKILSEQVLPSVSYQRDDKEGHHDARLLITFARGAKQLVVVQLSLETEADPPSYFFPFGGKIVDTRDSIQAD